MTLKFQETLKELSISVACLLDEPTNILVKDIEHIQNLVTEIENIQGNNQQKKILWQINKLK